MKLILISPDPEVSKICRETLHKFEDVDWRVAQAGADEFPPDADVYIWDSPQASEISPELDARLSRCLCLLERHDAERLHHRLASAGAAVLLKPVTAAQLFVFLRRAAAARNGRPERDEVLQRLLDANLELQQYDQDRT